MNHVILISKFALVLALLWSPSWAKDYSCNLGKGEKHTYTIPQNEVSGTLMDGPGGIRSNSWCEYRLPAQHINQRVRLTFSMVQMLSGDDFIWVYDVGISMQVPIQRITGTYVPKSLISSSSRGFVLEFRSS